VFPRHVVLESGRVTSFRESDRHGIARVLRIVLTQFVSQAACVHAYCRIRCGVEPETLAVKLGGENMLFEFLATAFYRFLDNESKKRAQTVRTGEDVARQYFRELCSHQRSCRRHIAWLADRASVVLSALHA
jgi:hypothetical protein